MSRLKHTFAGIACMVLVAQSQVVFAQVVTFTDTNVNTAVESKLFSSRLGQFHKIDANTNGGVVTLTGSVDNLVSRQRATQLANSIRGVQQVVNRIEVTPPARTDVSIANDVQAVLLADPTTDAYDIRISVGDGIVLLTGTAGTYQEKRLAEQLASGVVGVRSVRNDVEVTYLEQSTDEKIKQDIEARINAAARFDESKVNVLVNSGAVNVSGVVGSAAEKEWLQDIAWVNGTRTVDNSKVMVVSEHGKVARRTTRVTDQQIANAVRVALNYNPRVDSKTVGIASLNGVVSLTGAVDSYATKVAAERDARDVYGVTGVRNSIRVRSTKVVSDEDAAAAARLALVRDPYVDRREITVRVQNGHAHLYGTVDSETERQRAEEVTSTVVGLAHVANHLKVDFTQPVRPDWEIKQSIEQEMWWSPFVDAGEVAVDVDEGVATLRGEVDTWAERNAASTNALDGGATRVNNQLNVKLEANVEDLLP